MNYKLLMTSVVLAAFIFLTANALAQPLPYDQYPYEPNWPSPNYPGVDYPEYPNGPYYPEPQQDPGTYPGPSGADEGHPSTGPISSQPLSAPAGSDTEALNYAEGQSLSLQEVSSSGMIASSGSGSTSAYRSMDFMMTSGLQIWTRYNGMWTTNPASVFLWRSTSILTYNDQAQRLWSWEGYPGGRQVWRSLGYRMPGYIHGRFTGDERGWHQLAMWGSRSGWSNVNWIYVW